MLLLQLLQPQLPLQPLLLLQLLQPQLPLQPLLLLLPLQPQPLRAGQDLPPL